MLAPIPSDIKLMNTLWQGNVCDSYIEAVRKICRRGGSVEVCMLADTLTDDIFAKLPLPSLRVKIL